MGRLLSIVTPLHQATKRDYVARMVDDKVHWMMNAKEYEFAVLIENHVVSTRQVYSVARRASPTLPLLASLWLKTSAQ